MLKRKITQRLLEWRQSRDLECLLIKGARQVGKTYAVRKFGESAYDSYIEINFIEHPELADIFQGSLEPAEIKKRISLVLPGVRFLPHETLLFLDEIQECPNARTALKFLAQDRDVDTIASGSLLGIGYKQSDITSVPVGYERQIELFPLGLEEFLWALGYESAALDALREFASSLEAVPSSVHDKMLKSMREYMAIGGMPDVVQKYIDTQNFYEAYGEQRKLLASYLDDIAKYAPPNIRAKARSCYESMPRQLAKENTKFKYGVVEKKGTARKFDTSVDWLVEANMVHRCICVSTPQFPLAAYERTDRFRLYLSDMGLLTALYGFEMMAAVVDDKLTGPMKGGYYENLVACMLASSGKELRYWMSDRGDQEIEFILDREVSVCPIEVKAKRGATASLDRMLARDDVQRGYKLGASNVGKAGKKVTLPLYMGMFLFGSQGDSAIQGGGKEG